MKQRNCHARSPQNTQRLVAKKRVFIPSSVPVIVPKSLPNPHVPAKKYGEPIHYSFPTGSWAWRSIKPRRSLNQRQKRKQNRQ
jgi:hypothetical protein